MQRKRPSTNAWAVLTDTVSLTTSEFRTQLQRKRFTSTSRDTANPDYLDQIENQDRLEYLLKHMSDPIARMDNALKDIYDNLEGRYRNAV